MHIIYTCCTGIPVALCRGLSAHRSREEIRLLGSSEGLTRLRFETLHHKESLNPDKTLANDELAPPQTLAHLYTCLKGLP